MEDVVNEDVMATVEASRLVTVRNVGVERMLKIAVSL